MKKFELIPASRATRIGTNKTSSSGDENALIDDRHQPITMRAVPRLLYKYRNFVLLESLVVKYMSVISEY